MAIETARASFFIVKYVLETAIDELLDQLCGGLESAPKNVPLGGSVMVPSASPTPRSAPTLSHKIDFC